MTFSFIFIYGDSYQKNVGKPYSIEEIFETRNLQGVL